MINFLRLAVGAALICASVLLPLSTHAQDDGWSVATPLNSSPAVPVMDSEPRIATDNAGHLVAVWVRPYRGAIYASLSANSGTTWTERFPIYTSEHQDITYADVAYLGNGKWLCAWTNDWEAYVADSTDNGETWGEPRRIDKALPDTTMEQFIRLANDLNGNVIVMWRASNYPIWPAPAETVSYDYGQTWTTPEEQDGGAEFYDEGYRHAALSDNGKWFRACYAGRSYTHGTDDNLPDRIVVDVSSDKGTSWTRHNVVFVPRTLDPNNRPIIADLRAAGDDVVIAWFYYETVFSYDNVPLHQAYVSTSSDAGETWNTAPIGEKNTRIDSMKLADDDSGNWALVVDSFTLNAKPYFSSDSDIICYFTDDITTTWSAATIVSANPDIEENEPAIASDGNGGFVVVHQYLSTGVQPPDWYNPGTDLVVRQSADGGANWENYQFISFDALEGDDSDLSMQSGDGSTVLAAWARGTDTGLDKLPTTQIFFARSEEGGTSWSESMPVLSHMESLYYGNHSAPTVVYNGLGRWLIHWKTDTGGRLSVISTDDGMTWSPVKAFYGEIAASNRTGMLLTAGTTAGSSQVQVRRSTDAGVSWSQPIDTVAPGAAHITHSGRSDWLMVGSDSDIFSSSDDGLSWSQAGGLALDQNSTITQVTSDHKGIIVAVGLHYVPAAGYENNEWINAEIITLKSTDNGETWSTPIVAGSVRASDEDPPSDPQAILRPLVEVNPRITHAGGRRWAVVWQTVMRGNEIDYRIRPKEYSYVEMSLSEDDCESWPSWPETIPDYTGDSIGEIKPTLTEVDGTIIVGWETFVPYRDGTAESVALTPSGTAVHELRDREATENSERLDTNVLYSIKRLPATITAASDWALFE